MHSLERVLTTWPIGLQSCTLQYVSRLGLLSISSYSHEYTWAWRGHYWKPLLYIGDDPDIQTWWLQVSLSVIQMLVSQLPSYRILIQWDISPTIPFCYTNVLPIARKLWESGHQTRDPDFPSFQGRPTRNVTIQTAGQVPAPCIMLTQSWSSKRMSGRCTSKAAAVIDPFISKQSKKESMKIKVPCAHRNDLPKLEMRSTIFWRRRIPKTSSA